MNVTPQQILEHLGDLPTLPHIAMQVLQRIDQPETTARDLQAVLERDQAVAARVLRVANSAFYGLPAQVKTLRQAVVVLGLYNLRSVVLAACTQQLFETTGPARELLQNLWEHSLRTAMAARLLAARGAPAQAEEAFVAGLLHDLGKVALVRRDAPQYLTVAQAAQENGVALYQAEATLWGFDHATVGALMLEQWRLPRAHQEAVRYHHQPEEAPTALTLTALVSLANEISHRVAEAHSTDAPVGEETRAVTLLGWEAADLRDFIRACLKRVETVSMSF